MNDLIQYLSIRKNLVNLLGLIILVVLLPFGINLAREQQVLRSKALSSSIELIEGKCVKVRLGKKVLTCSEVPLKLNAPGSIPSGTISPTGTPKPGTSSTPLPGACNSTTKTPNGKPVINVKNFSNNIQLALDCFKEPLSGGGAVYIPTGTYEVSEKVRLYSNTTLFGDGPENTIIKPSTNFKRQWIPETPLEPLPFSPGPNDKGDNKLMSNDTTRGLQNIVLRDLKLDARPTLVDRFFMRNGVQVDSECCSGLELANLTNSFVINVEVDYFGYYGINLSYKLKTINGVSTPFGVRNTRISGCNVNQSGGIGVYLTETDGVVVDNCSLKGNGLTEPQGAIDLGPDNGTSARNNKILKNTAVDNLGNGITVASTHPAHKDAPVYNNAICYNNFWPNKYAGINYSKSNAEVYGNVFVDNQDGGRFETGGTNPEILSGPTSACDIPVSLQNLPPAPPKAQAMIKPENGGLIKIAYAVTAIPTPTPTFQQPTIVSFKIAESEIGLRSAQIYPYASSPVIFNYTLSNQEPGFKQIWVEFKGLKGEVIQDHVNVELVEEDPQIEELSCRLDITAQDLIVEVSGKRFGRDFGSVSAGGSEGEILSWQQNRVSAKIKKPGFSSNTEQLFKVTLERTDGALAGEVCTIGVSQLSIGAKSFCRGEGTLDQSGVTVAIIDEIGKKIEEIVSINKEGLIQGLKTKLEADKEYIISIKAPKGLRRNASFISSPGTTVITSPGGTPLILPVGDIFPRNGGDGVINSADKAELNRQWGSISSGKDSSGDFNKDGKINSFDWACMRYDFGRSDEVI